MSTLVAATTTKTSSAALATGSLDPVHASTLSVTYTSYPTPWPILLGGILISIFLGHIGWKSAFRSWHPHADMRRLMPQPGTDLYVDMVNKIPERRDSNDNVIRPNRWELAALQDARLYDPSDDTRPDGGTGFSRMCLTLFGAGWTTLRVIFTFALVLSAAVNMKTSLPDPWSIIVLLIVCQIYMSSRGFPRAINLVMAVNIILMAVATILSAWGSRANTHYYAKLEVTGGNCPFFWKNDCPLSSDTEQINSNMTILGCLTNSTWNEAAMGYPREAFFDPGTGADPNVFTSMYYNRMFVHYGGLIIAIFSLLWTFYLTIRTRPWIDMMHPLPELKMARLGKFANTMAHISYACMYIFIIYALIGHLFDELSPSHFTYTDSLGPPVNTSVFTSAPGSAAWDQSHRGNDKYANFLGGNSTTWSDCFTIAPQKSTTGHVVEWWQEEESKVLRVLALL